MTRARREPQFSPRPPRRCAGIVCGWSAIAVAVLALAGCRVTMPRDGAASQPAAAPTGNAELLEFVSEQPLVTADVACRAAYLLWKGEPLETGFGEVLAALKAGEVAPGYWDPAADECVDRALVGYLVCRAAGIRSGLNWRITGLGRYAWRELQYRRIAGPGSDLRLLSGGEFLGVITRAGEYMATTAKSGDGAIELGSEP